MNYQQLLATARQRQAMQRAAHRRQAMGRMRRRRRPAFGPAFHGADDGLLGVLTEPVTLYGIIPMGIAVVAGLWMATRG